MAEDAASMPMDKLVRIYRKIKTRVQELTTNYETELAQLEGQLDVIAMAMKDQMQALGVTSVKTAEGTAVLATQTRYSAQDWDAFKRFMVENDALDLVERRIAQSNMAQFLEQNPDKVPPGLNTNSKYTVSVRKPTK